MEDRLKLVKIVSSLPNPQFEQLVFAIQPPAGVIPSASAPQGDRTYSLLTWAESVVGPGLDELVNVLQEILGSDIWVDSPAPRYPSTEYTSIPQNTPLQILSEGVLAWNQWREDNPMFSPELEAADLHGFDLEGIDFFAVNLSKSNLSNAILRNADLRGSKLKESSLIKADLAGADLRNADLVGADFFESDLRDANLRDADLSRANFQKANLRAAQILGANLAGIDLTGACIEDWQIGISTKIEKVECKYIFRQYSLENNQFLNRLPVDENALFESEEFEQWIKVRLTALDTIDITFAKGIDWQAFFTSLQEIRKAHSNSSISMQSVGENRGTYVIGLRIETETTGDALKSLRAEVEAQIKSFYQKRLSESQGEIRALERSLDVALEKLAMASGDHSTTQNFYGSTGNVAGKNYGSMTAYINQNSDEITCLIVALREAAQAFPPEQKEDVLIEIDDLESDLKTPSKQDERRIGTRIKRLIAASTAAMMISGGVATVSGDVATVSDNLNKFTANLLELKEKLGIKSQEDLQQL
ncbi:hypothetical protein C8255_10560 [filamentous cyanobacterium CCP3]|nr:hypothetical protein C8255_10560 [filamentous cyanobacterium CCP3]